MVAAKRIAVLDIGKTNAKVVLFDADRGEEVAVRSRRNTSIQGIYRHYDVDGLWDFVCDALRDLNSEIGIDAISITTHGACFALLADDGSLALPVMDYEDTAPDSLDAEYRKARPPFRETGSPRLPMGLNAGAMIHWQAKTQAEGFSRTRWIVPWPQYWAFRLTGIISSEATSLGVHTDLWNPGDARFSSLVTVMGWEGLMPPVRSARDILGPVMPSIAERLGFLKPVLVHSGLHDSNASLLPHLLVRKPPFSVISTGTWVVTLSVGGRDVALDETRDTLINVNALGDKTPSARFMGGRAFELLMPEGTVSVSDADRARILAEKIMVLPSFPEGSGPYPDLKGQWLGDAATAGERQYAVSLYLALMAETSRQLVGAEGDTIVEGPFAANRDFLAMLAALTGRQPVASQSRMTGTSFGAACLALDGAPLRLDGGESAVVEPDPALLAYAKAWRDEIRKREGEAS